MYCVLYSLLMKGKLDELHTFLSCPVLEFLKSLWWVFRSRIAHCSTQVLFNLDGQSIQCILKCNSNNHRSIKTTFNFHSVQTHKMSLETSEIRKLYILQNSTSGCYSEYCAPPNIVPPPPRTLFTNEYCPTPLESILNL